MSISALPPPGQRWRSLIDGHTVVTGGPAGGSAFWIRYDETHLATAIEHAAFLDDYDLVDAAEPAAAPIVDVA